MRHTINITIVSDEMIDVNFDFQEEAAKLHGIGADSDRWSPTLQEYHRILWSKLLPNGKLFSLRKIGQNRLLHKSELGEFHLSSDRAVTSFRKKLKHIATNIHNYEQFCKLTDTIGGIVIWPAKRNNCMTINQARGASQGHRIGDRLDLTIECVRLYYKNQPSPLFGTFKRYSNFFCLFYDFKGFIDFFLLQDIVSYDYKTVKIATSFDNFEISPYPNTTKEFCVYMKKTKDFLIARNERIKNWCKANLKAE